MAPAKKAEMRVLVNQVLAFALEVALLVAVATWALAVFRDVPLFAGLLAVLVVAGLWAFFMAPRANRRLPWPLHPAVACAAFLGGALLLALVGHAWWALLMAVVAAGNTVLTFRIGPAVLPAPRQRARRSAAR